jgi:nitroimidazol reductase NimA-like FMN-containing flavoprotein (pyridoxamine 5'-phosphate oxidase superfamily)
VSRRDQIVMSDGEVLAFLDEERVMTCASFGTRGWPHLMPLWYVVREGRLWAWTFAKSQKVRNLERDPRATLQVEAGRDAYDQLRGVMLECEVTIHRDLETVTGVGMELAGRYGGAAPTPDMREVFERQAAKRVALEFVERHRATWDHRKLGSGVY